MDTPADLLYSDEHLWIKQADDGQWLAGITDYAQDLLGDIVYIEQPEIGATIEQGVPCGLVESVKTGSDLHAPLNGVVTAINETLPDAPEQINDGPYEAWIFKFEATQAGDENQLLDAEAYQGLTNEL